MKVWKGSRRPSSINEKWIYPSHHATDDLESDILLDDHPHTRHSTTDNNLYHYFDPILLILFFLRDPCCGKTI